MSILTSIDKTLERGDKILELMQERELLFFDLMDTIAAKIVVTRHNLSRLVEEAINKSHFEHLSRHKGREIVSLDCKGLTKEDTYGMMANLAEKVKKYPSLIVIIENIAGIWTDPYCEDPQYVENLIGHSWKNEQIYFGDCHIDRTGMTVILTTTPEHQEELEQRYRTDSYSWVDDFDTNLDALQKAIDSLQ